MVIVVDDEDRENEGDLVMAAHFVTPEAINFMIKHAKGLVCVPATDSILDHYLLVKWLKKIQNRIKLHLRFLMMQRLIMELLLEYRQDRSKSIRVLINPESTIDDIVMPGHLFPLRAREMGVLKRAGHTEAAVDLARLAGLQPAGVICEIIKPNGDMKSS